MVINHSLAHNFEDDYVIPQDPVILRDKYVIISGCSGSGKSTLLSELCKSGNVCIPEPGRQIVKEQNSIGGDGLPWINQIKFMDLTLSRYIYTFNTAHTSSSGKWIFFDRGIPDAVSHIEYIKKPLPSYLEAAVQKFRYHRKVFMTPPWPEIYRNDSERKHDLEEAVLAYESSLSSFKKYGYEVILVPKTDVKSRVQFILDQLNSKD